MISKEINIKGEFVTLRVSKRKEGVYNSEAVLSGQSHAFFYATLQADSYQQAIDRSMPTITKAINQKLKRRYNRK